MSRILLPLPLLLLALAVPGWGQGSKPYVWGHFAPRLTTDALAAAIKVATSERGAPWAVHADHSQLLPETHYIDAFMPPTVSTDHFRGGTVQRFECRPAVRNGDCSDWQATGSAKTYFQVAAKTKFGSALMVRTKQERPFINESKLSHADLLSLVAFIRARPQLPPPSGGGIRGPAGVSGREPITDISHEADGIWVRMSDDDVGGETATVRRTSRGWKLVDVGNWIR